MVAVADGRDDDLFGPPSGLVATDFRSRSYGFD
jgi:hypothetical protein